MSGVRLEGLSKSFKEIVAVDALTLDIQEGEFFSLLGPSGCGKTTTLRMIGGFEEPSAGTVYLGNSDVSGLPPYKRDVNTVFQSYALFPHLDVGENVAYGLKRKHVPASEIASRVKDVLALVRMEGLERRRVNQISGGQQQRVALARALVNNPQVLLLDEPLGALDLKLRKHMQLELKRIQQEVGITFIYVTHDQEEAMTMSDRLAVMNEGRLEQLGSPQTVYELPSTEFVASFLGASNLLDGTIESRDDGIARVRLDAGATVSVPAERLPAREGRVRVGVRPEKLHVTRDDDATHGPNVLEVTVVQSSYTGVSRSYECSTPDGRTMVVYVQNLGALASGLEQGDKVRLSWEPDHTFAIEPGSKKEEG